ncbi:MAG: adenylate/guanylate cyclase domain-containing protein [Flavobacterium sp.]
MALLNTLETQIDNTLSINWEERNGTVVPETDSIALKNGAVKIEATFLYADLAGSSKLAKICPWQTTAKIIRAYLDSCVRIIRDHGGEIRSFDGDRVMGIFKGEFQNTNAANCARKIDYVVEEIINPKAKAKFKSIKDNDIKITHCVGIDVGDTRAVRAGVRNNNDLIWIGKAPSFAAKLSDIRKYPYSVYISKACYLKLATTAKKSGNDNIWISENFVFAGETHIVYKTKNMLSP